MGRVIAVANQKGGVGKTTTVVNLGAALSQMDYRTLLVDLDPQSALSNGLGLRTHELSTTIYNALLDPEELLTPIIINVRPQLDLIPANIDLAAAEVELISALSRESILREALSQVRNDYDFILIDCAPSLGILTVNALVAANDALIPLQCEYLALRGMGLLLNTIRRVKARLNSDLEILGILGTMYKTRTIHSREVLDEVRTLFGERVFDIVVHNSIRFAEAPVVGQSLVEFDPGHPGAQVYRELAEVITNGKA